jgi:ADP-ribose pyrophosphatase
LALQEALLRRADGGGAGAPPGWISRDETRRRKTEMVKPWRVLAKTTTYDDPWLKVRSETCIRADGHLISPYHVLEYPDWVNVVALTPSFEIVLVRQYRHAVSEILLELPCGVLAPSSEDAVSCAAREEGWSARIG